MAEPIKDNRKDRLLDMEQSLHDSRQQRDDFRQASPPPRAGDRAAKAWAEQYGSLDEKAASNQSQFSQAVRGADSQQLDELSKRLEERRARKVEEITRKHGEDHLPAHARQFESNVQQVFRGVQGYDHGKAAQTVAGAAEDRQLEQDQNRLQSQLGRRATHDEVVAFEAQRNQGQQAGNTQSRGDDTQASEGQGVQFGTLAARRERGVSTYAERTAQASATQAQAAVDATPQKKRQQGNEDSFGQSM